MQERQRDDPQMGSRGEMNKREERHGRKILGEKESGWRRKMEVAQCLI